MPSTPTTTTKNKTLPPAADVPSSSPPPERPSRALAVGVALFVLVFGIAGYLWRGNLEGLRVGPGEGASADGPVTAEQISAMLGRLEQRLKEQPDDAEGWAMLGRSYNVLGRQAEALAAFRKAAALRPQDAQALADLADAVATANNRTLDGEPERLIAQALKLDPKNIKALALAGAAAFNRNDFGGAAELWQRAIDNAEPGSAFVQQLGQAVAEARQRAGAPPPPTAAASATVTGRVTLAPALVAQAAPDDTLYVFARAPAGPKLPLAIVKKQVRDLPFEFRLDDSMAMTPATRLSSQPQVVIGARITRSGNPVAQPGDLQGFSAPVPLGTSGVVLEISETVR
jgi:cytochrome c-type biogenesis protein CcmH